MIIVPPGGPDLSVSIDQGATLAQAVYTSGQVPAPALCSGLGRCGRCAMRYLTTPPPPTPEDMALFSQARLDAGWRLGCRHRPVPGARLELPKFGPKRGVEFVQQASRIREGEALLAVDLGTTSLQWQCLVHGETVALGRELNPQMGAGSEVMSRLAYAATPGNADRLRSLVVERLGDIVGDLAARGVRIQELCVAGNSVMTLLLLGRPLQGVSRAPYILDYHAGESVRLRSPGRELPPVYLPPLFSPFIGGDLSAGLACIRHGLETGLEYPFVLADLGTNGEFILALDEERHLAASVPLGPALEGIGLTHGGLAEPGAVTGFTPDPRLGLAPMYFDNAPAPFTGVTGSGYVSLLRRLVELGVLRENGALFQEGDVLSPLAMRLVNAIVRGERGWRLPLPGVPLPKDGETPCLLPPDVEEILKVKAACNLALSNLTREAGLDAHEVRTLYLAGAMGEHLGVDNLEVLGFIPRGMGARTRILGNSSLLGASLLLRRPELRDWLQGLGQRVRTLDLAGATDFGEHFFKRMRFVYTA